ADADLQILANVAIDRAQRAGAALTDIRDVEHAHLGKALPTLTEPPVPTQNREPSGVVEEHLLRAIKAHLAQAVGDLAADGPGRREVISKIDRSDVALLNELV